MYNSLTRTAIRLIPFLIGWGLGMASVFGAENQYAPKRNSTAALQQVKATDWKLHHRGELELETKYFFDAPQFLNQSDKVISSVAGHLYLDYTSQSRINKFQLQPFFRWDPVDPYRQFVDMEELNYMFIAGHWEFLAGIHRVFWGVTESIHLVDIINQSHVADDVYEEQKIGQSMLQITYTSEIGVFEAYLIGPVRERVYPGEKGRLRGQIVLGDLEVVSSSTPSADTAFRWSHNIGPVDIGIAHFFGKSRDPLVVQPNEVMEHMQLTPDQQNRNLLLLYDHISQTSIDLQITFDNWLIKQESIYRQGGLHALNNYYATVSGLEWVQGNILQSGMDFHFFAEYLFDKRGDEAPTVFENDIFLGFALNFNDTAGTEFSLGSTIDRHYEERIAVTKWSRRIGESLKIEAKAMLFTNVNQREYGKLINLKQDSHGTLSLFYHF